MTRDQMELYRTWVQQFGGGFVMIGGENSFGVGGYFRTPVEQMLPVRTDHDDRQETPSVALYIVLDRSGSMTAPGRRQRRRDQDQPRRPGQRPGDERPPAKDLFGLTAVDTQVNSVVPLARLGNKAANEQKILAITAGGGGIYIYTGLADALKVMRDAPAKIKHVILFSDAADAEEKTPARCPTARPPAGALPMDLVEQPARGQDHDQRRRPGHRARQGRDSSCAASPNAATAGSTSPTTPTPCRRSSARRR